MICQYILLVCYSFVILSLVASGAPQNRWRWRQLCKFCCSKLFKRDVTWCLTWDKAHHLTSFFHLLFARFASPTCLCQSVAVFAQRSSLQCTKLIQVPQLLCLYQNEQFLINIYYSSLNYSHEKRISNFSMVKELKLDRSFPRYFICD